MAAINGLSNLLWPDLVTNDGQINHHGMVRRMETFLSLMIPCSVVLREVLLFIGVLRSPHIRIWILKLLIIRADIGDCGAMEQKTPLR
jgi:hypothetical protein